MATQSVVARLDHTLIELMLKPADRRLDARLNATTKPMMQSANEKGSGSCTSPDAASYGAATHATNDRCHAQPGASWVHALQWLGKETANHQTSNWQIGCGLFTVVQACDDLQRGCAQ